MTPIASMAALGVLSWLVVAAAGGTRINPEAFYGMVAPLGSAVATWIAVQRAFAAAPGALTAVMITGFALKMVFFGLYVAVMLKVMHLRPVPFIVSFTGYFIALYAMEAWFLRRLTANSNT
jgi:hypothetical protein